MRSLLIRRPYSRTATVVFCLLTLYGCGGGDSLTPPEPFPNVAGSYLLDGGFDGLTRGQASFGGTLTLTQTSRQSGTLGGTVSLTTIIDGQTSGGVVPVESASVSSTGTVSFHIGGIAAGGSWTFSGTLAGTRISGRHTLTDGTTAFSGDWSGTSGATSTGSLTVTSSTSGSSPDPDGYTIVLDGLDYGLLGGNAAVRIDGVLPWEPHGSLGQCRAELPGPRRQSACRDRQPRRKRNSRILRHLHHTFGWHGYSPHHNSDERGPAGPRWLSLFCRWRDESAHRCQCHRYHGQRGSGSAHRWSERCRRKLHGPVHQPTVSDGIGRCHHGRDLRSHLYPDSGEYHDHNHGR